MVNKIQIKRPNKQVIGCLKICIGCEGPVIAFCASPSNEQTDGQTDTRFQLCHGLCGTKLSAKLTNDGLFLEHAYNGMNMVDQNVS